MSCSCRTVAASYSCFGVPANNLYVSALVVPVKVKAGPELVPGLRFVDGATSFLASGVPTDINFVCESVPASESLS